MTKVSAALLAAVFTLAAAPAFAAPPGAVAASGPPPAAAPRNTITIESSPEFQEVPDNPAVGSVATWYFKGTFAHSFGNGFTASGWYQNTYKIPSSAFPGGSSQQYYEADLAYKLAVTSNISLTATGGIGYTAGNTGYFENQPTSSANGTQGFLYYALYGAADWKVDSHWTWNIINARYRNGFELTWITPKVLTGLTYTIDPFNAVFANIGYSWKDNGNGQGLLDDKLNIALGYKYSF